MKINTDKGYDISLRAFGKSIYERKESPAESSSNASKEDVQIKSCRFTDVSCTLRIRELLNLEETRVVPRRLLRPWRYRPFLDL